MSPKEPPKFFSRFSYVRRDSELPQVRMVPAAPETVRHRRIALSVLLLLSFLSVARLAAPVWMGIVFGALMAFTAQPLYRRLCYRLGARRGLSAALTTFITGMLWALTGASALYVLTRELFSLIAVLQLKLETGGTLSGLLGSRLATILTNLGVDQNQLMLRLHAELGRATQYATAAASLVLQTTTTAVLGLVVGCITMYHVLLEWPSIPVRLERVLPLDPRHTRALVLEFRDVGRSALVGTVATALLEGIVGTIGYALTNVPHAITWGLCTVLSSFLPIIGTAIVWVPVSLYLIAENQPELAIVQAAWGLFLVVGIGDYIVRPRLVGRGGRGHTLLTLVGFLGGVEVFGLPGLVVGPVLMALFLAILRIYERELDPTLSSSPPAAGELELPREPPSR